MNDSQVTLFEAPESETKKKTDISEWGTFKDSLKAPVHRWFTYPAGFSYKAVEHTLDRFNITAGQRIYDPFMGSGTTNIVAKSNGINSFGIEAHPFVIEITKTKLFWEIDTNSIISTLDKIEKSLSTWKKKTPENLKEYLGEEFPELILKCFLEETLYELLGIRNQIRKIENDHIRRFLKTALICTLRDVSIAATGWPYIAPNKIKITSMSKKGFDTFKTTCLKMAGDLSKIRSEASNLDSEHDIVLGDSRKTNFPDESADHIFTSPPYLNNFDYADRTRLEMYFMGDAKDWKDISKSVRTKLMTSATTQISRTDPRYNFKPEFVEQCPEVFKFLNTAVTELGILRNQKGGKKSYDLLVTGYFNDIYDILKDNYRILKPNSKALYILGDSAPYGVHIPTDELIGQIGICVGFKKYSIELLRTRGGKWKENPQRHNVALRETVVILEK
jgi:DNA modification methylase